jgi:hypothetical protein
MSGQSNTSEEGSKTEQNAVLPSGTTPPDIHYSRSWTSTITDPNTGWEIRVVWEAIPPKSPDDLITSRVKDIQVNPPNAQTAPFLRTNLHPFSGAGLTLNLTR